jgi:hypothetical protein
LRSSGRLDQRDGQAMAGPGVEPATPRFSVVHRGATAGHGRRRPAKISLQIASIATIATCGPFRVTPALVRARGRQGARSPGSARMRMSVVSGDVSAGEASAVRPARLPPEADARAADRGRGLVWSRRRSRVRVPSLTLRRTPASEAGFRSGAPLLLVLVGRLRTDASQVPSPKPPGDPQDRPISCAQRDSNSQDPYRSQGPSTFAGDLPDPNAEDTYFF